MSRPTAENLPPSARAIALLIASTPTVQDAQPAVLHQLLEFSHRYSCQVLSDAQVYAEHAGRSGKVEPADVTLAVQARVGWEFGGRVPKEYLLNLATQTNAVPLPAVQEVFGVRLPPPAECLTGVDFDLIPNKPPPGVTLYDEEIEEVEESESEEDEEEDEDDMEVAPIPGTAGAGATTVGRDGTPADSTQETGQDEDQVMQDTPFPISAIHVPEPAAPEEASDDEDGLFAGGDDDDEDSDADAMEQVQTNGVKRKLVEEDDYD